MAVGTSQSDQDTVGVPGDAGDGAAKGLLQVLGYPPVVLFLKVADGSNPSTASDGELCLVRRPSHTCSGSVDAEEDESGAPGAVGGFPDVCVAVLRAGDNLARVGGNVDAGNELVVTAQLIFQSEAGAIGRVQLDCVVASDGESLAVGREGVVGDGMVEEVVDLRSGHGEWKDRSISLLSLLWYRRGRRVFGAGQEAVTTTVGKSLGLRSRTRSLLLRFATPTALFACTFLCHSTTSSSLAPSVFHRSDLLVAFLNMASKTAPTNGVRPNHTLYCSNLPDKLQKDDLKRALYMLFSVYGSILDIVAMKTSKMRGQANVLFRDVSSSTQAMRALQGFEFFGKEMV